MLNGCMRVPTDSAHLVTLCRFDDKTGLGSKPGPFIPWERRLAYMEYLRIQGRAFGPGFLKQGVWQASLSFLDDTPDL